MGEIWQSVSEAVQYCFNHFTWLTIVDLLLVTYIIFVLVKLFRHTRATSLIKGIIVLVVLLEVSELVGMPVTNYLLSTTLQVGILAAIIIFQPELRRALDKIGRRVLGFEFSNSAVSGSADSEETATAVCEAVDIMSAKKIGAIIAIECTNKLDEWVPSGTVIDARLSAAVILSIFYPGSAMHDGAVIIRSGRVHAAGCFLPLTVNNDMSKQLGTRHRATVGLSEVSDAFVIVVSEETGTVSFAEDGVLTYGCSVEQLKKEICKRFSAPKRRGLAKFFDRERED